MPAYLCLLLSLVLTAFSLRAQGNLQLAYAAAAALAALATGWLPLPKQGGAAWRLKPLAVLITAGLFVVLGQAGVFLAPVYKMHPGIGWVLSVAGLILAIVGFRMPEEGRLYERAASARGLAKGLISAAWLSWACYFVYSTSCINPQGSDRVFILFDDAMVSLRYAWNLAHGQGLVWNPGERVEGFTNLLQTLLMAIGCKFLGLFKAALFAQVLGGMVVFAAALAVDRLMQEVSSAEDAGHSGLLALAAFALTLFYYPLNYWSLEGMETGLVAAFMLWSITLTVRRQPVTGISPVLSLLLGLAVLSRPDAMLLAGLILMVYSTRLLGSRNYKAIAIQFALFAILPAAATAFRVSYYGEWVPNTYFLKLTGLDRAIRLASGWAYTKQFLVNVLPLLWLAVAGLFLGFNWRKLFLGFLFTVVVAYQIWIGGDAWLYWRFLAPVVPLLFILGLDGVSQAFVQMRKILSRGQAPLPAAPKTRSRKKAVAAKPAAVGLFPRLAQAGLGAAILAVSLGAFVANKPFLKELSFKELPFIATYNFINLNVALMAKKLVKPGGSCGVTWAGTIPYFSQLKAVDFLGKCDKRIARLPAQMIGFNGMPTVPGHNKYDLNYSIKELKPDFLQIEYWGGDDLAPYAKIHYTRVNNLLVRNDSPMVDWDMIRREKLVP